MSLDGAHPTQGPFRGAPEDATFGAGAGRANASGRREL